MSITLILLLSLALFIILVFFYWGSPEAILAEYEMNIFLLGFTAFILLFCGYMVVKELEIKRLKHIVFDDEIRIKTLKEFDEMKSDLIAVVSHELRSPLTSVKNAVDIVMGEKTGKINDGQEKFLSIAYRNIDRLMGLINDLLDVSKIDSGKMKFRFNALDINLPIDAAIASLKASAENKSIKISKEVMTDGSQVYGDSDKLEQVFINLVDNAIKFTPDGGEIRINVRELENDDLGDEKFTEVVVEDTGIGMDSEVLEKIFDRFYQAEKALSTMSRQGTGLGLAIIKGVIEGHQGKIWVESKPEKGTKFIFILPQINSQRILMDIVRKAIERARENKTIFSLLIVSLENSEYLKKTFGDKQTLKLMDQVCRIVYNSIRKDRDTLEYQRCDGRVIVILNDTPKEGSFVVIKRIKDEFSKHGFVAAGNKAVKTNLALGVSSYPEDGAVVEELLEKGNKSA